MSPPENIIEPSFVKTFGSSVRLPVLSMKQSVFAFWSFDIKSDFHIIELAGNISEVPNLLFLKNEIFKKSIDCIVFAAPQNYEFAHQFIYYFTEILGYDKDKIILSGKIGNDNCSQFIQDEVIHRLKVPICNSVKNEGKEIIPDGAEIVDELIKILGNKLL